jgi:lysine N6-hydroxylase
MRSLQARLSLLSLKTVIGEQFVMKEDDEILDVAGVGIGPFNLSVAALMQPLKELRACFYERAPEFQWHSGLLFPEATIQVSFLKDLVTPADPTNPYSFVAFLFATKRLYRFINAGFPRVMRTEFNQYLRWVCASLTNLRMGCPVEAISVEGNTFALNLGGEVVHAKNIVLGSGVVPAIPECARPHLSQNVFLATQYLNRNIKTAGKRVTVIGGGQTGAEVFYHLICDSANLPKQVNWVSRRPNFLPLDESPFTNELFTPNYSDFFFSLPEKEKPMILAQQKLASDGVSESSLQMIYRRLYELEFLNCKKYAARLYPNCKLVDMSPVGDGSWALVVGDDYLGRCETIISDVIVLCTGTEFKVPQYLEPMLDRIPLERGHFIIRDDFSIEWDGPRSLRIYVQNAARHARGVSDPNLSLMAWRSAKIINSLVGRYVYDIEDNSSVFDWSPCEIASKTGAAIL